MEFFSKFIFFSASIVLTYSSSLSGENIFELLDENNGTNCSCDWRYLRHYDTKGCVVEATDSCGCPQKFSCPANQTQQTAAKVCIYQNKEYKVGSKIITSDICKVCRCRNGVPPYISCVHRECPQIVIKPVQGCHLVYKKDECCPVGLDCYENDTKVMSNKSCEYDGKLYPFGSKIYPVDDPCQTCICDENWNNGDNSSCYLQDCMFEKNKLKLDAGCIPVYHESRCCPVEFYCPSSHNLSYSVLSSNESSDSYNASYEDHCIFAGQMYALGEELFINNPCVKCNCFVPPDFTCIHQSCPSPPSAENCYAIDNPGECCPSFECMVGDAVSHSVVCPTPVCAHSGCRIETPPGHDCPTCVCEENNSELEHNNLEQVQQFPQNNEQFEHVQQLFEPVEISDDYSEDELQMMPMRMQDSEGQISVVEKMILPELENIEQFSEGLSEIDETSFEDNFSTETVINKISEENGVPERENSTFELDLEDVHNETASNRTDKVVQKRSNALNASSSNQRTISVQQKPFSQQEINEDIEREGGDFSSGKDTSFDDELENIRNKLLTGKNLTINEIISINHEIKVPPGCPTPMCEGPWCRIGILPGGKCPTCICKRPTEP